MGFRHGPWRSRTKATASRPASEPPPAPFSNDGRRIVSSSGGATSVGSIRSVRGNERWFRNIFSRTRRSHPKVAAATAFYWRGEAEADEDRALKPMPQSPPSLSPAPLSGEGGAVSSPPGVAVVEMITPKQKGAPAVASSGADTLSSTSEHVSSTAQESLTAAVAETNTSSVRARTQASTTVGTGNVDSAFDRHQRRTTESSVAEPDLSSRATHISPTNKGDDGDSVMLIGAQPKLREERQNPSSSGTASAGLTADWATTTTGDNKSFPQHSASRISRSESEAGASIEVANTENGRTNTSSVAGRDYSMSRGGDVADVDNGENQWGRARGWSVQNFSVGMAVLYLDVCRGNKVGDGEEARRWRPAEISGTSVGDTGDILVHVRFSSSDVVGTRCRDGGADTQIKAGGEACLRLKCEWHRLAVPSSLTEKEISSGAPLQGDALIASKRNFRPRTHSASSSRRRGRSSSNSQTSSTGTCGGTDDRQHDGGRRRERSCSHRSGSSLGRKGLASSDASNNGIANSNSTGGGGDEHKQNDERSEPEPSASGRRIASCATTSKMTTATTTTLTLTAASDGDSNKERDESLGRKNDGSRRERLRERERERSSRRRNREDGRRGRSKGGSTRDGDLKNGEAESRGRDNNKAVRDRSRGRSEEDQNRAGVGAAHGGGGGGGVREAETHATAMSGKVISSGKSTSAAGADNAAADGGRGKAREVKEMTGVSGRGEGRGDATMPAPMPSSTEVGEAPVQLSPVESLTTVDESISNTLAAVKVPGSNSAGAGANATAAGIGAQGATLERFRLQGSEIPSSRARGDGVARAASAGKTNNESSSTGVGGSSSSSSNSLSVLYGRRTTTNGGAISVERHAQPSPLRSRSTATATSVGELVRGRGKEGAAMAAGASAGAGVEEERNRDSVKGARRTWNVGEPGARGPMAGDRFDCLDHFVSNQTGKPAWRWREAEIVEVQHPTREETEVLVHFVTWASKWNRWISLTKEPERFAPHLSAARPAEERINGPRALSQHDRRSSNSTLGTATLTPNSSANNTGSSKSSSSRGYASDVFQDTPAFSHSNRSQGDRLELPRRAGGRGGTLTGASSSGPGSDSPTPSEESAGLSDTVFRESMRRKGLSVVDVEPDGNCLFRSVSHQIYGDADRHGQVRKACVEHMSKHKARFGVFVAEDFRDYLCRIRQPGVWGDDLEIRAMEEMFDRPIEIFSSEAEDLRPMKIDFDASSLDQETTPIKLSYHGQSHYNSVRDKSLQYPLQPRRSKNILHMRQAQHARTPRSASVSRAGGGRAGGGHTASRSLGPSRGVSRLHGLKGSASSSGGSGPFGGRRRGRSPGARGWGGERGSGSGRARGSAKKKAELALRTLLGGVSSRIPS